MTVGIDKEGWRGRKRVKKSKKKNRLTSSPSASPARLSNQFNSNFFINLFFCQKWKNKTILSSSFFYCFCFTCRNLSNAGFVVRAILNLKTWSADHSHSQDSLVLFWELCSWISYFPIQPEIWYILDILTHLIASSARFTFRTKPE